MSDKSAKKTDNTVGTDLPDGTNIDKTASAGLQSVMAVIGDAYDPAVAGAADKVETVMAPKLTDKIDAARGGESASSGLQSIMDVIGEDYVEDQADAAAPVERSHSQDIDLSQTAKARAALEKAAQKAAELDRDDPSAKGAISELLPMLTSTEQDIANTHHQVVSNDSDDSFTPAGAASQSAGGGIQDLLGQLKKDISTLDSGTSLSVREQFNMPDVIDSASGEMQTLLAQLQGDISALRVENSALKTHYNPATVLAGQGPEMNSLISQLQGDIAGLRSENTNLRDKHGIPVGEGGAGMSNLLAQLQGDISGLRRENDAFKNQYNRPGVRRGGASIAQTFLMSIGLVAIIGGATLGGMFYANSLNDQSNDNLFAMFGLQEPATSKPTATERPSILRKAVVVEEARPPAKPAPRLAAITPPPPPALPKVNVQRTPRLDNAEVKALLLDAQNLIELGDLVSARQMLEYAMSQKSAEAAYRLAQTYDPLHLATMASVLSVEPNITRAKVLYYSAARQGHQSASKRLSELRRTAAN